MDSAVESLLHIFIAAGSGAQVAAGRAAGPRHGGHRHASTVASTVTSNTSRMGQ